MSSTITLRILAMLSTLVTIADRSSQTMWLVLILNPTWKMVRPSPERLTGESSNLSDRRREMLQQVSSKDLGQYMRAKNSSRRSRLNLQRSRKR